MVLHVSSLLSTRANGFKKQTELLRQKHQEFLEKYKIGSDGAKKEENLQPSGAAAELPLPAGGKSDSAS